MGQEIFNPLDYGFRWTDPEPGEEFGWYEYDGKPAEKAALRARNARARELERKGYRVRKFSLGRQLCSRGGIGTGHPHIELFVPCYGLNADKGGE